MQSPFDNRNVCALYLEPMLNTYFQSYQNILTVSNIPEGPLAFLVQKINAPKLSPFQTMSTYSRAPVSRNLYSQMCLLALCRYPTPNANIKSEDNFMYAEDIVNVMGYLESNGYKILSDMTKLAYKAPICFANETYNKRQLIFMFKYEGK